MIQLKTIYIYRKCPSLRKSLGIEAKEELYSSLYTQIIDEYDENNNDNELKNEQVSEMN